MVKAAARLVRTPTTADTVVLARAALPACFGQEGVSLPFPRPPAARLLSEAAFRARLGLPDGRGGAPTSGAYAAEDVVRLAGLPAATVEVLTATDMLGAGEESYGYPDLADGRQVAALLRQGRDLRAIVAACAQLAARGVRLSQVRLAEAPWGGLAQAVEGGLARLDGQFALILDDEGATPDSLAEALASEDSGALADAERWYGRAAQADRRNPVPLFNLGNLLAASGRDGEASLALQQALARDPEFAEAAFNLAELHEKAGRAERAVELLAATALRHPHYAQAFYNLARLLTLAGRFAEALPVWEGFVALAPDDADVGHARRAALLCRLELRGRSGGGP